MDKTQFKCIFCGNWVNIFDYEKHTPECHDKCNLDIKLPIDYNDYRNRMFVIGLLEEKE